MKIYTYECTDRIAILTDIDSLLCFISEVDLTELKILYFRLD